MIKTNINLSSYNHLHIFTLQYMISKLLIKILLYFSLRNSDQIVEKL